MPKGLLSNLAIDEVAFCGQGMNPLADMVLWKAKPAKKKAGSVEKMDDDEPITFAGAMEDARAMDIDQALDARLHALLAATTQIMRAEGVDREALVLQAVNDYAEAMGRDVPELFAGRLAKMLAGWEADGPLPDDDVIRGVVKSELEVVGLAGDVKKGENMDWLKTLTKEERDALDFVLAGNDPAEFFKGTSEEAGLFVAKLVKRAVEATTTDAELTKTLEELTKARTESGSDEGIDAILKSISDPSVRSLVELQRSKLQKQGGEISELKKAEKRRGYADVAKSLGALPNENGALVDMLEKADGAGILDELKKTLTAANHQAEIGKAYEDLGVDTIPGEGSAKTPAEADEALMAKAAELRKAFPDLTDEQLYVKASEQNPQLYAVASGSGN